MPPPLKYAADYNVKRMKKFGGDRHLTKHNYGKRSTCCLPLKVFCPWTLLKNPDRDIGK